MKRLIFFLQQFFLLLVIVHCTLGVTTSPPPLTTTHSSSQAAPLPSVEAKNFLELKAGSWPSADSKNADPFFLRHLSRPHEPFFYLGNTFLRNLQPNAPFLLSFRYWASHDLARIRVFLASGSHQDYLLDKENQWTDVEISIQPAKSGRWTHLELLGSDPPYTFALKNATVHYTDKAKEEQHTLTCNKEYNSTCRVIFADNFSLISQQYVVSSSNQTTRKYIPVSNDMENENSFALNLTLPVHSYKYDYCLHFNYSSPHDNPLLVAVDGLPWDGKHYFLTYRSYDGPIAKVCTSWLKPSMQGAKQIVITYNWRPYGQLDHYWVQLLKAELVELKIAPGMTIKGTDGMNALWAPTWAELFVNVPPSIDLSKNRQISFKLEHLQTLRKDHYIYVAELSTIWFNALEMSDTHDKVFGLVLTPSGDYNQSTYFFTEIFTSSPTHHKLIIKSLNEVFPKENASQLAFFNCSDRFAICEDTNYFKLTFQFEINLGNAVRQSVQQVNINYGNVSINEPCIDPATGLEKTCNGNGRCVPYPWKYTSSCLCHHGFTGKQCEHALPTLPTTVQHHQTSKATPTTTSKSV